MRISWLLVVTFAGVALARPDIGLELRKSQQPLSTSYGVPSASVTGSHINFIPPSPTFGPPLVSTAVPFYSGPSVTVQPTVTPIFYNQGFGVPQVATQQVFQQPQVFHQKQVFQQPQVFHQQQVFQQPQVYHQPIISASHQPAQVQKHVYFFEAPQEPEEVHQQVTYNQAPAKKNVKILFIKAPSYRVPVYPQALYPQQEDKTIVYVLVKKPEAQEPIVVEPPPPTQPAKPEVFFIKYKNQQEAEEKVQNTLNSHAESGVNVITNNIETAPITGDSLVTGLPFVTTASPLGLVTVDGGFIGTSTFAPIVSSSFPGFDQGVSITSNGIPSGHFVSSTEAPTIISSTYGPPVEVAPAHPTYSPPVFVSSTEAPIVSSTYAPAVEANSIPESSYGAPPNIHQTYGAPSKK